MLFTICTLLTVGLNAQITITNATFPSAGDTLRSAIDDDPVGINVGTPSGSQQTWIFTSLQPDDYSVVGYANANTGINSASYPGADLVIKGSNGETYLNKTTTKLEFMGFAGSSQQTFNLQVVTKYTPHVVERYAPLNFFDVNQQTSNLTLPLSTDGLPDSLFQGAPFIPDSIRIRLSTNRLEIVDGWGNCQIPGGDYPVLRVKRTDYTNTALDVKIPFLGWQDLSTLLGGGGGGGQLGNFLGTDTTVTYRFLSGTQKEEIAVATMSNDLTTVESVRYKDNAIVDTDETLAPGTPSVSAYPNPAIEWVRFDCYNLPKDRYTFKIFNIIGKTVWKEERDMTGTQSFRIELDNFKKGTYLYSLLDSKGNIIGTKRLVVLKP
jgi:hypothetical protein